MDIVKLKNQKKFKSSNSSDRQVKQEIRQDDEVDLAFRVLQWMIFSGKFDDTKASNIRKMLISIFGGKIVEAVKERYLTA